ncbi:uncharacterized protein LOC117334606 isoform X2 [Pecten maximus]|uniref:uncharacterized protein LOC117334606 isoform X2 n=1 Tax=Pecten maximus TaxID=6579 RepID=UPI0014585EE6|nr:uncharacterized protein LOC117334606 isoform X2 [Pecten maximus]
MGGGGDITSSGGMFGGGERNYGGTGGPASTGGIIGMQGNPMSGLGGGVRRPDGSKTMGPSGGGNPNFGGTSMGYMNGGTGQSRNVYGGGDANRSETFTTPQNFMGQGGTGLQYGESQLPPTMAGGSGGAGGAGREPSSQDPAQQLIGYVRTTAESCTDPIAHGMNTILILDTSKSMQGEGLQQAKIAIEDILTGIEDNVMDNGLEENLALIAFGKETRVVQHLTNDYMKFRDALETLHPEGPSSITDSLVMTLGMTDRGGHINLGGHVAKSRIIILSDSQFTQNDPSAMFNDVIDPRHAGQIANEVSQLAHQVINASGLGLYFIPVGNVNNIIMESVIGAADGEMCPASEAKFLSKGYLHHVIAGFILSESQGSVPDRSVVAAIAREKYHGVEDRDIDTVMKLILEDRNPQGQGLGRNQTLGQRMGPDPGQMSSQLPSQGSGAPPGSLPPGIFNGDPSSRGNPAPLPSNQPQSNIKSKQDSSFLGMEFFSQHLPTSEASATKTVEIAGTKFPVFDLSGPLPPGLPSALIGGEGAKRYDDEDTETAIKARILQTMEVPPELEETRKRTRTLTEEIIEEMKRDLAAGKDAPKPWDSPCLQEFLLIRKNGTKIEQDSNGIIIGDDEEAVLRREEKAKQKLLYEKFEKVCETHPDLHHPDDDDDIGDLTEERVNELLDDFGGGPPSINNLPIMPRIGLRVKPGPDWMWRCNGVGIFEEGTVIGIDKEDEGWIRVRWDKHDGLEEDYRWGLDYEFDVEPIEGGMSAVCWPEGRERIIKTTQDIADEFGPKQVKERLRRLARARREKVRAEAAARSALEPTTEKPKSDPVIKDVNTLNLQNTVLSQQAGQRAGPSQVGLLQARLLQAGLPQAGLPQAGPPQAGLPQVGPQDSLLPPRIPTVTSIPNVSTASTTITTNTTAEKAPKDNGQTPPAPSAAKSSESCFVWQYVSDQGDWKNYTPEIQKQLEGTYLKRREKGTVIIEMDGQFERVVFQSMEQRNNRNKKKIRKVRRIEADAESLRELQEMWAK